MLNGKDIKRRIQSVSSTQQITKAMKMVSAAKLTRTQRAALGFRPYADRYGEVLGRLAAAEECSSPLLARRPVRRTALLVITGDRGLAGGFHLNLIKRALEEADISPCPVDLFLVGARGEALLATRGRACAGRFPDPGDVPAYETAAAIAEALSAAFAAGTYDRVDAVYQAFLSPGRQESAVRTLLPLPLPEGGAAGEYLCEEGESALLERLLPEWLVQQVYQLLLESKAGEHVARMMAMSAATDNAKEMIDMLSLRYNQYRQAAITREISEIVGGAAALSLS